MKTKTEHCSLFSPIKPSLKETCANCLKWTGKQCGDEGEFQENYEDTARFKAWDRMMRSNRGVTMV
ncbi:hypothetical protein [Desulfosporosinus nitroreducens]|uniref:hypothetical protein n=1 Tax=Desulfosporosinus nitroreducens TaxID=2018668 RepID=UPI00207D36ED|nr:hypothetical protein [Desulfosporosinus nitroreducens]MCO1603668.1 hypothetical protein [Desulfosporosinus nitroreducens]